MHIKNVSCPRCTTTLMVDERLWALGTVRLRCPSCEEYFLPSGTPHTGSIEAASNAGVPITVWEPRDAERIDEGT